MKKIPNPHNENEWASYYEIKDIHMAEYPKIHREGVFTGIWIGAVIALIFAGILGKF